MCYVGLISVLHGETTLPVWSYIVALISGAIVTPFSTLLYARVGDGIATNQLFKMIAGAINSGRPVANLYVSDLMFYPTSSFILVHFSQFSMWSHDVVGTSIGLAGDLKLGQYLKVSVISLETLAEMLILSRKDSSPCHVFISTLGSDYWYAPRSTTLMFGTLMVSVARGFC